ncbi:GIY-YIG nuclease family protein [Clostridium kluyveri]|uniref:LuxR family transcriptional regulator n=2 Tax=Clostridium kluyveri TaxID=1534 RepID=A5N3C2_CLOK5|nr:GIY-YIG nuclease family protein [Clostridium kluyveri]EDK35618.1 Conserved hypothetical protein [Clostridium kluyveri DSM 555]BAH08256.1 hypothetical protein CKR_3205 [Clostridium kluyveri NBRC 12016]
MDGTSKKQIIKEYKQREIEMGIIRIYNTITGYCFVDISNNLYKPFEGIKFQLELGRFKSKQLQKDWNIYGQEPFKFDVVEKLKIDEDATNKQDKDDLEELLQLWISSQGENLKLYD